MTVQDIINIAKISQYLCVNDIRQKGLYGGGVDLLLPRKLYCVRKNVEWLYNLDSSDESLTSTSNYLYSLCGKYALAASQISCSGGSVSPINPNPSYVFAILQASVANGDMTAGQSTLQSDDLIGAKDVEYFVMNNMNYTVGVDFSFNSVSGTITLLNSNTWQTGDLLVMPYSKKIS